VHMTREPVGLDLQMLLELSVQGDLAERKALVFQRKNCCHYQCRPRQTAYH
jgi:hypothetical protein